MAVQPNHKDMGMVDALGKFKLEDLCLQPPLQEIFNLQTQDVIELHLTLVQYTNPHQTPEQSVTWKTTQEPFIIQSTVDIAICLECFIGLIDEEFLTP